MVITIGKLDIAPCYGVARDTEPGPFTDGAEKSFLVHMIATSELWSAIIGGGSDPASPLAAYCSHGNESDDE